MILLEILWSYIQIGLFSFGGGMASIPLIQYQVVELHGWLTMTEFTDLITIAEMTPGPIGINSATFVGMHIAGMPGALVATLGCILPACFIVSFLAWLYYKYKNLNVIQGVLAGLRPAVVALIASAGLTIFIFAIWGQTGVTWSVDAINWISLGLFTAGFVVLRKWKLNPIYVMLGSGVVGGILYLLV